MAATAKKGFGWHGTGTLRRNRWDAETSDWVDCEHMCPNHEHGIWVHRIVFGWTCHWKTFAECPECMEVPNGYGKPLSATKRRAK